MSKHLIREMISFLERVKPVLYVASDQLPLEFHDEADVALELHDDIVDLLTELNRELGW